MIDYRIKPTESFTDKIGELVSMLEHTRAMTLLEVSELNQSDLDYLPDESSNSIGSLLLHIASIEFVHQIVSTATRDLTDDELTKWQTALELGDKARERIRNYPLEFYLKELTEVREDTLFLLKSKEDSWLLEEGEWGNGVSYNHYYLWFHVMEDEISHRGQIKMIKRLLKDRK